MRVQATLFGGFVLLSPAIPSAAETVAPNLSGRWVLNTEESEDAREKMRGAGGGERPRGGRVGGGERGPGGGGPRGGGMGGGGPRGGGMGGGRGGRRGGGPDGSGGGEGNGRQAMRSVFQAPAELTITHTGAEIAVLEKDGRLRALHPDGKAYKDSAGAEIKTRWDSGRLLVETRPERGPTVGETFVLEAKPRRLVVRLQIEGRSGTPITVRRVYDASAE